MKAFILIGMVLVLGLSASGTAAQTNPSATAQPGADPAITASGAIGEVTVIDAGAKQMIIKTDAGSLVTVVLNDATSYMRVAPGEKPSGFLMKRCKPKRRWSRAQRRSDGLMLQAISMVESERRRNLTRRVESSRESPGVKRSGC